MSFTGLTTAFALFSLKTEQLVVIRTIALVRPDDCLPPKRLLLTAALVSQIARAVTCRRPRPSVGVTTCHSRNSSSRVYYATVWRNLDWDPGYLTAKPLVHQSVFCHICKTLSFTSSPSLDASPLRWIIVCCLAEFDKYLHYLVSALTY